MGSRSESLVCLLVLNKLGIGFLEKVYRTRWRMNFGRPSACGATAIR